MIQRLVEGLSCGKPKCACAKGRLTHCPAHDDSTPSMTLSERDGKVLFHCQTGCSQESVILALRGYGLWPVDERQPTPIRKGEPVAIYRYLDADGNLVGEKGRFESTVDGVRHKTFLWRLPNEEKWSGLAGLGMESMPLYNLASVLNDPGAPVWVTEGEKAATALISRGIVATCLAGGASQTRFGNALDPLRDRDVILWPDNDEAGQGLMARVASYLPRATFVRPLLPEKGDAYDYFEQGGTLDSLDALLQTDEPAVTIDSPNAVTVTIPRPDGHIKVAFAEMAMAARALDASLSIKASIPGLSRVPYTSRINMNSQSAVSGHVTMLNGFFGTDARAKDGIRWANVLMTACSMASEAWRGVDRSIMMSDVDVIEVREWLAKGLIPLHLVTIPFGMGGGGKSLTFGIHLTLHALLGRPWLGMEMKQVESVLIVDYEDTQEEWRLRFKEVAIGMGLDSEEVDGLMGRIRWLPGNGIPLVDQAEQVRKLVTDHNAGLMIVDSCISAVGGDLMDTVAAQRLVNWQTALGRDAYVTTVMLAHNPKNETKEQTLYPYGNVFWHNLPRSTVYVDSKQEDGSRIMDVALRPRKGSRGKIRPIPLRITFPDQDGEAVTFETLAHIPMELSAPGANVKQTVANHLSRGSATSEEIAVETAIDVDVVRSALNRHSDTFRITGKAGRANLWGLKADDRREEMF